MTTQERRRLLRALSGCGCIAVHMGRLCITTHEGPILRRRRLWLQSDRNQHLNISYLELFVASPHEGGLHTGSFVICRAVIAASPFAFRQTMMVSINGFGFCLAICPSAEISWSKFGSAPGPQTSSTGASDSPSLSMAWLILLSAWPTNYALWSAS